MLIKRLAITVKANSRMVNVGLYCSSAGNEGTQHGLGAGVRRSRPDELPDISVIGARQLKQG